jgi:hypothetical protein
MQSLHHVGANLNITPQTREKARRQALSEAVRVIERGPIIIIQRDPSQNQAVWFWKYFPEALETKLKIQPNVSEILNWLSELGLSKVQAYPVHDPMAKGFFNPESPLDSNFRKSFSDFSYLTPDQIRTGIESLSQSIIDGSVHKEITECKEKFKKIGGTVFFIQGHKV